MRFHRPVPLRTRPSVSVVVPCYRYGHYLPDAVASALDQPGVDVEVIIVDDASPDRSAEVARALAAVDRRVSVVVHEHNQGHIRTYNDGLDRAGGDYVVLLSADDVLTPGSLTRAAAVLEAHPRVGLVYGYARSFTGEPPADDARVRSWSVYPGRQWLGLATRRGRDRDRRVSRLCQALGVGLLAVTPARGEAAVLAEGSGATAAQWDSGLTPVPGYMAMEGVRLEAL